MCEGVECLRGALSEQVGCISREGEICGGVWRCGVCEGELSAQVGCISREGEI